MTRKTKAELYLAYLDRILAGEKDIGPVEDEEVAKLLRLAQSMIAVDSSVDSKIRESLKKQLLEHIRQGIEDELTEEELMYAAAGLPGETGRKTCPRCGARFNGLQERCPVCRY
ncbi:MAG TPA: hypothetical protein PLL98_02890 [Bacillota bacterium]|nr:hypothetical protein [Bacillota bacterium]HOR85412.1 hypothetical protein [Bacillota bacterium]HPL53223.1 hypothetical protein [Bacillota bacterium]